jgi:AraC-like DNA-binding protein
MQETDHTLTQRASDLDSLLTRLEVDVVKLTECLISPGWQLCFPASEWPALHYSLDGCGEIKVGNAPAIAIRPHTLVIVPALLPVSIEVTGGRGGTTSLNVEARQWTGDIGKTVRRIVAGEGEPATRVVCGYFRATYGVSIDLFKTLASPIVERFDVSYQLASTLTSVVAELNAAQVGMHAMTTALLKQVLVTLLRRSLKSSGLMMAGGPLPMLQDANIARVFADMVARPGAPHSLSTLSDTAGLSRSVFMTRFVHAVGHPPMAALRQLRMRQAADLLAADVLSIEKVALAAGFSSRSSFVRAFRHAYGTDPSNYRAMALRPQTE